MGFLVAETEVALITYNAVATRILDRDTEERWRVFGQCIVTALCRSFDG